MTQTTLETATTAAGLPQVSHPRNPGLPLDMDWVMGAQANTSAIERRCATLPGRRTVKKEYQAAWLARPNLTARAPASTYRGDFRAEWRRMREND